MSTAWGPDAAADHRGGRQSPGANELAVFKLSYFVNHTAKCQVYVETRDENTNRIPGDFTILIR